MLPSDRDLPGPWNPDTHPESGAALGVPSLGVFEGCPTGTFEYSFDSGEFSWSDEVYRVHGYERGQIIPTFELGLTHIVPELRDQAQAFWADITTGGGPLSSYLTLQDAKNRQRQILVTGDMLHQDGVPVGVWGLVIDLTYSIHADSHRVANEAVAAAMKNRGMIEQAKGILIGQTGITAEEAFELISQRSQDTNRKVQALAQDIVEQASRTDQQNIQGLHLARTILDAL